MSKVLITGGNKGIGRSCTELFLKKGYHVIIMAREASKCDINHKNLQAIDIDLIHTTIDLSDFDCDDCDILINNAGIMNGVGYEEYTNEQKSDLMKLNVQVPVELITQLSPHMKKNGGRIISLGSIAGHIGHKDIWYGISKAAVHNFTKSFAKILGPEGVQITCVTPGPVNTSMLDTIPTDRKDSLKKAAICGRFADPSEIADVIYYLAVDAPEYINGICIDIKNGMHFRG